MASFKRTIHWSIACQLIIKLLFFKSNIKKIHTIFELKFDPTLEHYNSVIFSSILKKQMRFEQLFELSTRISNRNFAILTRLGVTSIAVVDIIFDEKIVLFFIHTPSCVKNRVCIKDSKFKKLRTYDPHKIEYGQTYVFKNAKFLEL